MGKANNNSDIGRAWKTSKLWNVSTTSARLDDFSASLEHVHRHAAL